MSRRSIGTTEERQLLSLIEDALEKQRELRKKKLWSMEMPAHTFPIVWFGDMSEEFPDVLTLAANPSIKEFNVDEPRTPRFNVAGDWTAEKLQDAYNDYFQVNPYWGWFGKLESYLNGIGASFILPCFSKRAVHFDLVPFATSNNFTKYNPKLHTKIAHAFFSDLFTNDNWGTNFVRSFLQIVKPKLIVIFGTANISFFRRVFPEVFEKKPQDMELGSFEGTRILAVKEYLGGPSALEKGLQSREYLQKHLGIGDVL